MISSCIWLSAAASCCCVGGAVDFDTVAFMLANPGVAFSNYFTLQCAVLRKNHPSWSNACHRRKHAGALLDTVDAM